MKEPISYTSRYSQYPKSVMHGGGSNSGVRIEDGNGMRRFPKIFSQRCCWWHFFTNVMFAKIIHACKLIALKNAHASASAIECFIAE